MGGKDRGLVCQVIWCRSWGFSCLFFDVHNLRFRLGKQNEGGNLCWVVGAG